MRVCVCVCVCVRAADSEQPGLQNRRDEMWRMLGVGQIHFIPSPEARLGCVSVSATNWNTHTHTHTCATCHTHQPNTYHNEVNSTDGLMCKS